VIIRKPPLFISYQVALFIGYNLLMQRDNQTWLTDLHSEGEQRDNALNDLREILLRVLPNALSRYLSPEGGHFDAFLDDVVQETLMRVIDKLGTFEGRSQFTTWVYKIAIRIALSELRLRKWKEVSLDGLEAGNESDQMPSERFASSDPNPEAVVEQKDAMALVRRIIQEELTPRQRTVMMAINVQGVPLDVVAQRIGTNRNALYKMMHDARLKLKHRLEREGLPPEELLKMFGN
jgi:RNA polymerase sigma-70 factor (ECF subfamily)